MARGQAQAQKQPTASQIARIDDFSIPADEEDWNELVARKAGLKKKTIHTIPADWVLSASEATNAQYVMLRSYSPPVTPITSFENQCRQFGFTSHVLDSAANVLAASTEWTRYLSLLETEDHIDNIPETSNSWPGSFSTVKRLQEQSMTVNGIFHNERMEGAAEGARVGPGSESTRYRPRRIPQLPDSEDEATVNAAAIILLQAVSQFAHSRLEWVMNRVHFACDFGDTNFNAFTDGALRAKETMNIFAIVEVKKTIRSVAKTSILVQEACEVVGWLMHSSAEMAHFNAHFMLISQDRHELFVTFVPFENGYEEYLRNGSNTDAFLVMRTFGPFHTAIPEHMQEFGRIILAAILIVKPLA